MYKKNAKKLINSISQCTCSFTTVQFAIETLERAGFRKVKIDEVDSEHISAGDRFYINVYDSSIFAFALGEEIKKNDMLRIVAAHTDSPSLYIKPSPEMNTSGYGKINVEMYGGLILNTWMDRPLSVAGKLSLKSSDIFSPETVIVDFKKELFTIPNLAIHLNRDINKGTELNRQKDMMPICALLEDNLNKECFFMEYIAKELDVDISDILDFELYIYNSEKGCIIGIDESIISSPRLDNITSVEAAINSIINANRGNGINAAILFDNEEIGSRSKQGADSILLSMIIEKIYYALGYDRQAAINSMLNGFMISADVAHGFHPNYSEKSDITNINKLGNGIVIKRACSQTYGTDSQSIAIIEQLCRKYDIPYQKFASRSDVTTGSTLGNIANKYLPLRTVDIGVPILAMHSAREAMGAKDQMNLENLITAFYSCK